MIDANGDSALTFSDVDSWVLYANAANRDANTNILANGTALENHRFNFNAGTVYYLRLESSGTTLLQDTTPTEKGETEVSLSTPALLVAQGQILQQTRDHARAANTQTHKRDGMN